MFAGAQMLALTVAAAVASIVYAQPSAVTCSRSYVVQQFDVCDQISAAQNVSTYQIVAANSGRVNPLCTNIFPGESICLGVKGQDCSTVHVVKQGDFCQGMADAAGTDLATFLANNPNIKSDCSNIYVGEVLCTATTRVYPPATTSS